MKNTGFIKPNIDHKQYVLGGLNVPFNVLKPDGDWRSDRRPIKEIQKNIHFDTFNCTSFNTLNQIEQYMYVRYGLEVNYSDRWLGIIAGTKPPGNDPHVVYEAIRKYGLIDESMLPFTDEITTVEDYYSFKGGDEQACYKAGREWLEKFDFKHEWIFNPDMNIPLDEKINNIKEALKVSPLAMAVYAWECDHRDVYIRNGPDVHWTSCDAFTDFLKVYDSYDPVDKDVEQELFYVKRIDISIRTKPIQESFLIKLIAWFMKEKLIYREFKKFLINLKK